MLHILFLILKIIGIILLVILGIALTLVGTVLFVPVRYRVKTETTDGMKGVRAEAKATWLFHLISAFVTYQEEELDWKIRIGWKKIRASEEDVGIEENVEEKTSSDTKKTTSTEETSSKEKASGEEKASDDKKSSVKKTTSNEESASDQSKKKDNWIEKIKCTIREICDKIKNIEDFLMEEAHIQAFLRLKKELVFLIKKIKPDKMKGYLRFGLEDPYNTGRVLAVFSVFYPFYGENIQIYPEFEREIIEGDVYFKGRIHLIHLLLVFGRTYFDKNVKTAYKKLKELRG